MESLLILPEIAQMMLVDRNMDRQYVCEVTIEVEL
jgi:hypothetical protein